MNMRKENTAEEAVDLAIVLANITPVIIKTPKIQ
ncbi:MAG: hypothetical protein HW406_1445 [Candidatus Brocadiaceae bacterium]|nr:hypothetical protein [Candidatus Brocadiaceae bacterium]